MNPKSFPLRVIATTGAALITAPPAGILRDGRDPCEAPPAPEPAAARTAALWQRGVQFLAARFPEHPLVREMISSVAAADEPLQFSARDDGLLGFDIERALANGALAGEEGCPSGLEALVGLAVAYVLLCRLGQGRRDALHQVSGLYLALSEQQQAGIIGALGNPLLDPDKLLTVFLRRIAGAGSDEQRDRHVSWLLGQSLIDLPYDRSTALAILHGDADPDAKRRQLYGLVCRYDRERERGNIERVSARAREHREALIFGRMSRAFHNQGLLFADAVLLRPGSDWPRLADELAALSADHEDLRLAAEPVRLYLGDDREVSLIALEGALERFEETALDTQRQALAAALRPEREWVENHADRFATAPAGFAAEAVFRLAEQRLKLVQRIRRRVLAAERRAAAYVVISQRPSPTGSHLLVKLNEFEDPYAGKPDNLSKLMRLAGDRVYGSPDYGWLEVADHWIEAIPLFIKEEVTSVDGQESARNVIDIAGMEQTFREDLADHWANNIRKVLASEFLALAREAMVEDSALLTEHAILDRLRAEQADPADPAALGLLFSYAYRRQVSEIRRLVEREQLEPFEAMRAVLPQSPLVGEARRLRGSGASWQTAAAAALRAAGWSGDWDGEIAGLASEALEPRRPLPALHVLTTQAAGMTDGYVRTWLEESMALYNAVESEGLQEAVACRMRFHARRIAALATKLIRELGLWVEVEELQVTDSLSVAEAIQWVARRNPAVRDGMAVLGTLLEFEEVVPVADRVDDPESVLAILRMEIGELREQAMEQVVARNGEALLGAARRYRAEHPEADPREALHCVVAADEFLRSDLDAYCRIGARRKALQSLDQQHPDWHAAARCQGFLRRCQDLAKTTARKEILAERGRNGATLDPVNDFRATGGGKRYHLLYCPSRVDLGQRERESVETWSQWVGGADPAAAQVGRHLYGLINKDVRVFESLSEPELLKTGENASMASHYAYSNALAMMVAATRRGDFESLADQMNRRQDRRIHPAGEGYGGYCVPKDGLFLEFVLGLRRTDKLSQIGLPESSHGDVVRLAERLLDGRGQFACDADWEDWAIRQVRETDWPAPARQAFAHLFQVPRVARIIDTLGRPELRDPARVAASLAARWGLHKMVTGGEQVNRFMPFFKVWLMRLALADAIRRHPASAMRAADAVIVLTAEYKPDTQDGRFSAGMRKFEILAGTGGHLLASLDGEGQDLAVLLSAGYDALRRHGGAARFMGWLEPDADGAERLSRLFPVPQPPAEIRLVAPTGLSTLDLLNYTSDSRLTALAQQTRSELLACGLADREIDANLRTHGPRLDAWHHRSTPAAERLQNLRERPGGGLQALALSVLGPERDYPAALRGADLLDTGVPHRSLMNLLADPGQLCELMLDGNPRSCLAIVDGASGARARAMNALDVMLWFAAAERRGREAVYHSVGVGEETVEGWRATMRRRRRRAENLRQALQANHAHLARQIFRKIVRDLRQTDAARGALDQAGTLARNGRIKERDRAYALALAGLSGGFTLERLDFTAFLALGGLFLLAGADPEEIAACRAAVEFGVGALGHSLPRRDEGWRVLLPAGERPPMVASAGTESGFEGSNKATEEDRSAALETRRQLAGRLAQARALNQRYAASSAIPADRGDFAASYDAAMACLGPGTALVAETDFGRFIAHARNALQDTAMGLAEADGRCGFLQRLDQLCNGRRIDPALWQTIAGGYEDIGDFGRLAQQLLPAVQDETAEAALQRLAKACELFQILLAVDCVQDSLTDASADPLWHTLADFFARTLNDHHYEYRPWLYSRGTGFSRLQGDDLYRLAVERHGWLYRYLRFVAVTHTELRDLPSDELDGLLGNFLDGHCTEAIGAEADSPVEGAWRAYGQLREIAFLRNDGFPLPAVFPEFDPELIDDRERINHVVAAPVGRTHVSRLLREGPTLSEELRREGRRGANIIVGRKIELDALPGQSAACVNMPSGHLLVDEATYRAALARHQPGRPAREVHPKGIRIAARFTRPVRAALVYPFHGTPAYASGAIERAGLPYAVQSLFHTWTTYDKTKYPDIFRGSGVELPAEIDWDQSWTAQGDEAAVKARIRGGWPQQGYAGLADFAKHHSTLIIKDAAESGGRNMRVFDLRDDRNRIDPAKLAQAVDFAYQISLRHSVAIQEVVQGSPECWATGEFMDDFVRRQITEWGLPVQRRRQPRTPIHGSFRVIVSTDDPEQQDPEAKWHVSHLITLNSRHTITNVGRGGTLEQLLPEFIRPEHREELLGCLTRAARQAAEALSGYHLRAAEAYRLETGRQVGTDLTGVSYGKPRYLMLDFLIAPRFAEEGDLVAVGPSHGDPGSPDAIEYLLNRSGRRFPGTVAGWRVFLIEPNIGIGLWDRVALREEFHEFRLARQEGREPDWSRVGVNARIVLHDLNRAGEQYLDRLCGNSSAPAC